MAPGYLQRGEGKRSLQRVLAGIILAIIGERVASRPGVPPIPDANNLDLGCDGVEVEHGLGERNVVAPLACGLAQHLLHTSAMPAVDVRLGVVACKGDNGADA